jgi:transposase-like protein
MFAGNGLGGGHVMIELKGNLERQVVLWAVRWYVAYPISYRQLEEMMHVHRVEVDHATLGRDHRLVDQAGSVVRWRAFWANSRHMYPDNPVSSSTS